MFIINSQTSERRIYVMKKWITILMIIIIGFVCFRCITSRNEGNVAGSDIRTTSCMICKESGVCLFCCGAENDCTYCDGTGKCAYCLGVGSYKTRIIDNREYYECKQCHTKTICSTCNGEKTVYNGSSFGKDLFGRCHTCFGSGKCTRCNGIGFTDLSLS